MAVKLYHNTKNKTCSEVEAGLMYYTQRFYITNPKPGIIV